ncbi:hypothetical protein [Simplicispira lacusdiani]|uniref:hypothetical protein n=1 Tax=Simplicispira lacusdiani TaxID=2213010 RepID=UPI0013004B28|nr:hypothetical protein [Simplicispira lacusdiani]
MYFHAPRDIYGSECFRLFMAELGGPKAVHRYLGVTERTVYHWLATGRAPRAAVLALFWESKYGRSHIYTDQVNEIRLLYRQVCLLREQFQRAKEVVTGLRALNAGSANEPLFEELPDFGPLLEPSFGTGIPLPLPTAQAPEEMATGTMHASPRAREAMQAFERNRQAPRA